MVNKILFRHNFYRIYNAIKLFFWALKNPTMLRESNFKMLSDLFTLIMKVASEDRHMMTHLAYVHPEEGEKQIVSIWAGAGMAAEPTKRISELISENSILKSQLSELLDKKLNKPMSKEKFIEYYCKNSKITKEELLKTQVILPCNCNYEDCKGWAVVSNNPTSIKAHLELYT